MSSRDVLVKQITGIPLCELQHPIQRPLSFNELFHGACTVHIAMYDTCHKLSF